MSDVITRNKKTDLQAIREWYLDERGHITLTEHQERRREMYMKAASMQAKGKSNKYILQVLYKDYGISQAVGYRVIRESVALYGQIRKAEKEGIRYITYEMLKTAYRKAKQDGKPDQMINAANGITRLMGLDREDPEMPDFEKLKPSLNIVVVEPSLEKDLKNLLKSGPVDLDQLRKNKPNTIDVEHEEIKDEDGTD